MKLLSVKSRPARLIRETIWTFPPLAEDGIGFCICEHVVGYFLVVHGHMIGIRRCSEKATAGMLRSAVPQSDLECRRVLRKCCGATIEAVAAVSGRRRGFSARKFQATNRRPFWLSSFKPSNRDLPQIDRSRPCGWAPSRLHDMYDPEWSPKCFLQVQATNQRPSHLGLKNHLFGPYTL